jgi:hypothetical protein
MHTDPQHLSIVFISFVVEGRRRPGGGCYGGLEYEELGSRIQEEGEEGGLAQEWRDRAEQELQEKAEWRTRDIQALRSERICLKFNPVLGIRDILVRIRIQIPGSEPLTNGSGSNSFIQ